MINLFCIRPKGSNVGNDTIYLGMQQFVYEAFGEFVNLITLPATARHDSHAKAGLTAQTIYEINQYGHGVIIGGGNLYENGELDVNLDALALLEPPLFLFSLSRGKVYNRRRELVDRTDAMPDRVLHALDRKALFAMFRDQATADHLLSIGCQHHDVGGCPTIYLDAMRCRLPQVPPGANPVALISVRNPSLMSIPLTRQCQVRDDVRSIVSMLRQRGYPDVRLLCHDHRDISFAASFSDVDYVYTGDVFSYLAMLNHCALNVSYRLHGFLPCVSFGRPTIKISYDQRALSLIETVGLAAWNIDMIRQTDVVRQVADRLDRLADLAALREMAQPRWDYFHQRVTQTFHGFAHSVRAFKETTELQPAPVKLYQAA